MPAANCSSLIPSTLKADTPGAPMPSEATVGAWEAFSVQQTGQLDKANSDKSSAISIVQACETRDAEARKAATAKKGIHL